MKLEKKKKKEDTIVHLFIAAALPVRAGWHIPRERERQRQRERLRERERERQRQRQRLRERERELVS